MKAFTAFRIHKDGKGVKAGFEQLMIDDLTEGEVVIKVSYSGINYKDALAATGKGRILRSYPLNGGVDLAGRVVQSQVDALVEGDSGVGMWLWIVRNGGWWFCRICACSRVLRGQNAGWTG